MSNVNRLKTIMTNEVDTVYSSGHSSSNMFVLSSLTDNALPHVGQFVLMREFGTNICPLYSGWGQQGKCICCTSASKSRTKLCIVIESFCSS